MKTISEAKPGSDEWLRARRGGVGATDISVILGDNPWKTQLELQSDKLGITPPRLASLPMRQGAALEPLVIELARETRGVLTAPQIPSVVAWDEDTVVRASLDGLDGDGCPVEAKTAMRGWSGVPSHYEAQCMWQAGIMDAPHTTLAVLHQGEYDEFRIPFDRDWWDWATDEAAAWWDQFIVELGTPPASAGDDLSKMFAPDPDGVVEVPADQWSEYVTLRHAEKTITQDRKDAERRLQQLVGDATAVMIDGQRVATWRAVKGRKRFDQKAALAADPTLDRFMVVGEPGRSWRLT